jgi:tetratricopeptide (TPR) repeat protein
MALPSEDAPAAPDLAVRALIEFGLKESKSLSGRPSAIEVRDPELQRALSEVLSGGLNTSVVLVEELPAVAEALRHFESAAGDGRRFPGALEGTGVTVDQLRAFADAAAAFFQSAPWRHLTNEDLIVVKAPQVPTGMRQICVLGNAGQQFGLAFFESRRAFEHVFSATPGLPRRAFGVTYGPIDDLPFADVDAWEDLALPVADPRGYPLAADLGIDGSMRRLDTRELAAAEALLRALARTTEDEFDTGSWQHTVATHVGVVTLELTLPLLVEAEQGRPAGPRLGVMPRLAERSSVRLARLFEGRSFESLDEANAAIERAQADGLFEKGAEAAAGRPLTALEQAQELAYDAMEATGRLKVKLARRALALSEDCGDACIILAEATSSPEEARDWYQRGVDAGARALGPERLAALAGEFWGHLETRPYMRARLGLAQILRELGQEDVALDHYRELLRLNPNDNQGVRYLLLPTLLEQGRDEEADRLIAEYEGDIQAMWPYAKALRTFRVHGDGDRARAALRTAVASNPLVARYLLAPEAIPPYAPPHFALGSTEEGAYVAEGLHAAFDTTLGALAWLRATGGRTAGRRTRRAGRSRRRRR